jgi:hypothetical protein
MIIVATDETLSSFVQHSAGEVGRWILDIYRKTRRWKILQQRRRRQWWNDARRGDSLTLVLLNTNSTTEGTGLRIAENGSVARPHGEPPTVQEKGQNEK